MMPNFPLEETKPNWNTMTCPSLHSQQKVEKPGRSWEVSSVSCSFYSHEGLGNPNHIVLTSIQGSNNNPSGHRAGVSYWDFIGRCIDTLANNCSTQGIQIGHHSHFPSILRQSPSPSSKGVTGEALLMRLMAWFVFLFIYCISFFLSFFLKELLQSALSVCIAIAALPTSVHHSTIYNS